jgi:small nuclear ribonucleoprotein D3
MAGLSVPVKLLKEGEGHVVSVELKSGDVYRGQLMESEDTMNLHLSDGTLRRCTA